MRWAHRRAPALLQNDTSLVESMKDINMVSKYTNKYIFDQSDLRVAHTAVGVRSKMQEKRNSTISQRQHQTS